MTDLHRSALLTDLYQLTMLQGYLQQGMTDTAVFEFFVRKLPPARHFLLAAGLEQVLDYLEQLQFTGEELDWLAASGKFTDVTLRYLESFRFSGDVHAMAEGTLFFPNEPILRITAPLPQAQLVESRVINLLHFQTLIASKAARCVLQAPDKLLVDFGFRRAHGSEAGLLAARASFAAGFAGTATVAAGAIFGIPTFGTMAHSFVQAHDDEALAFEHFALANPGAVVLLIDTYDTEAAVEKVIDLAPRLRRRGIDVKGGRIDSGDLIQHARQVRTLLDRAGLNNITLFASGSVDEYTLREHAQAGAPIDGYGIGTHLDTSADAPYLDCAYKLQEYAGTPRRKRSEGKATWPGRKQVYRRYAEGRMVADTVTVEGDKQKGEPLLRRVMKNGGRTAPRRGLDSIRAMATQQLATLPPALRDLAETTPYPVIIAPALQELAARVDQGSVDTPPRR